MSIVNAFLLALVQLLFIILEFYVWAILIGVVLSWLVQFGIVNPYNRFISIVMTAISRITEPLLRPIRKVLPYTGPVDFSPVVLLFGIYFIKLFVENLIRTF